MVDEPQFELGDDERRRIRQEMQYALAVIKESAPSPKDNGGLQKLMSYLSNGFVLLLVGSLITSFLVPRFQKQYETKKQKTALMQECLAQFLLYGNSIWQEYYAIFPLAHNTEIDKETYNKYIGEIGQIKLRRYDAYAKVQALAIAFRDDSHATSTVETALRAYAIHINRISTAIDAWLRNLYCAPDKCVTYNSVPVDSEFQAYDAFLKLEPLLQEVQNDERKVSEIMVTQIKTVE
jgi:hypothetical protein